MSKRTFVIGKDFNRVLLTETLPNEVPIIFSNEGLYKNCKLYDEHAPDYPRVFFDSIMNQAGNKWSIPLGYKIKKDQLSLRKLALIHPRTQRKIVSFYASYHSVITYFCKKSKASLRAPVKVASTLYVKDYEEKINKYKKIGPGLSAEESGTKYLTTFFSYYGYDRFYKFFSSKELFELEKKYSSMWMLDVMRCFESIYTHTISWAVKTKSFAKKNIKRIYFGQKFDEVMQNSNHQETNGIIIGPEISRIFSEIILQDVDKKTILALAGSKDGPLEFGKEYEFRRYVDDFIIFAASEEIMQIVSSEIIDQLSKYNLHVNDKKLIKLSRPFFTSKSQVAVAVGEALNEFIEKTCDRSGKFLKPKTTYKINKIREGFINKIKSVCARDNSGLGMATGILIPALSKRIVLLVEGADKVLWTMEVENEYLKTFLNLLEAMFYFYSVSPTVNSSYHLSKGIVLSVRFFQENCPGTCDSLKLKVTEYARSFLNTYLSDEGRTRLGFIPLEKINILLALTELGVEYLYPAEFIKKLFRIGNKNLDYFELMSCFFYIKNHQEYAEIKSDLIKQLEDKLKNLNSIHVFSETAYIFLDAITCPFIEAEKRKVFLKELFTQKNIQAPSSAELDNMLVFLEKNKWFIDWEDIDLLSILQKKQLQPAY